MAVRDRLWAGIKIDLKTGCWIWLRACDPTGYGRIRTGSKADGSQKIALTHRASYEEFVGPIPDGYDVCHHCDNPPCINPDHLFAGTRLENVRDCIAKGRARYKPPTPGEDNPQAILTNNAVLEIRATIGKTKVLAEKFGVSARYVRMIRAGKFAWAHLSP